MKKTSRNLLSLSLYWLLGSAIIHTMIFLFSSTPLLDDAPAPRISSEWGMQDLEVIAYEPHPMSLSPAHAAVRDYLLAHIRAIGTRMYLQVPGQPEYELFAASETRFYDPGFDLEITFYRNDRGEVDRMEAVVLGEMLEAMKVP